MTSDRPTPEQQQATARRYTGQRAPGCRGHPEPSDTPTGLPEGHTRLQESLLALDEVGDLLDRHRPHRGGLCSASGPGLTSKHWHHGPRLLACLPLAHSATIVFAAALGDVGGVLATRRAGYYLRLVWTTTQTALMPIPSLAEIEQQFGSEGCNPSTLADVVAMHRVFEIAEERGRPPRRSAGDRPATAGPPGTGQAVTLKSFARASVVSPESLGPPPLATLCKVQTGVCFSCSECRQSIRRCRRSR